MESLEMLANNLANIETGGFKADREFFSLYSGDDASADPMTGEIPVQPLIESHWTDLAQGNLLNTANPLDLAIDGEGLFAVQTAAGVRYTRNGRFRIGPTGLLTATDGNALLGRDGNPVQLQAGLPIDVLEDGTVQQGGAMVSQLNISMFEHGTLAKMGANYFVPAQGAVPQPATGLVVQGKLEQSNVGAAESSVRLIAIMRQFEMLQKAMSIGNELNRKAIEEVAKVTT